MKPTTINIRVDLDDIFKLSHHEIVDGVLKYVHEQSHQYNDLTPESSLEMVIKEATKASEDNLRKHMHERYSATISGQVEVQR
ncbi:MULTISPECIES: hypothetical protein [Bacillus]|uniref:hypothetical protein n=1 Tax=Bacillus TaxID=1386 RepID=UPI00047366D8|nr:hypothetical protein [Bacillus cereus]ANE89238.1 hypothetical protein DA68_28110 [Bacillus cereus]MDA2059746.1 hypothetical protein [Bacillus cereus]